MKLKEIASHIDSIESEEIENVQVQFGSPDKDVLSIIGLFAPLFIAVLNVWKRIPGKKQSVRNLKIDKAIAALEIAALVSTVKFKK